MGEQHTSAACEQAPHLLLPCLVGQERHPPLRQKGWHRTNYYSNSTERGWAEEGDLLCWRDSAPGPRDAEKMQRKWTTAIRKPDRDLTCKGGRGEPRLPPGSATALRWMDAWPTTENLHLLSLPDRLLGHKRLESLCQADLVYKGTAFCRGKGALL